MVVSSILTTPVEVKVPPTLRFSPIPTPPVTVNAPVDVLVEVVLSVISTVPLIIVSLLTRVVVAVILTFVEFKSKLAVAEA